MLMKQAFIIKQNNPHLLLFFAGWGMDKHPFEEYAPSNHDFLVCYDYTSLDFDYSVLSGYETVDVVAWSMGVWAASQIVGSIEQTITNTIAINGTPYPIDDNRGIPEAIFNGTLEGLNEATLKKFQRRMCGSADNFKHFQQVAPQRSVDALKEELAAIGSLYKSCPPKEVKWSEAYIGLNDRIFPATNQQAAWKEATNISSGEESHYDEPLFKHYLDTIWTKS